MTVEFNLPELGEGIEEADVVAVLVREGDTVSVEQAVITIETEKATVDVPSSVAGTVSKVHVASGATVKPGQLLITVEAVAAPDAPAPPPESAPPAVEPRVETPQAEAAPIEEPAADTMAARPPDEPPPPPSEAGTTQPPPAAPPPPPPPAEGAPAFAAPSVRQFAREIGVNIREVQGSGPGGRISEDDVKLHARSRPAAGLRPAEPGGAAPPLPDFAQFGPVEREPLSRFRRTVARNMTTSWSQIPYVTLFHTADMAELEEMRRRYRDRAREAGGTLTNTVLLLKLVATALKEHPRFNSSFDAEQNELILKQYVHLGLAVETERGLSVAVIRDVDKKDLVQLSVDVKGIAQRADENALTIEEMRGASFTVSSLEALGVGHFTPLVNWPEVAILGVGRADDEVSYARGEIEVRRRLALSLSLDHRVVDGADGARFLRWLVNAIHEPSIIELPE